MTDVVVAGAVHHSVGELKKSIDTFSRSSNKLAIVMISVMILQIFVTFVQTLIALRH
jgi:hypothetical protein